MPHSGNKAQSSAQSSALGQSDESMQSGTAQTITQPQSQSKISTPKTIQAPPPPVTPAAGLDPQSPAGAPPELNPQGQVTRTSVISQTRQGPSYGQNDPASLDQSNQWRGEPESQSNLAGRTLAQVPIKPTQSLPQQDEQAFKGVERLTGQSTIQVDSSQDRPGREAPAISSSATGQLGGTGPGSGPNLTDTAPPPPKAKATQEKNKKSKTAKVKPASTKDNKFLKIIPFALVGLVVIAAVVFGISRVLGGGSLFGLNFGGTSETGNDTAPPAASQPQAGTSITYWGLWEPNSVVQQVFNEFEQETGIKVLYEKQSPQNYRTRLESEIASGQGPDVFRFHATWVPMLSDELAPMPTSVMSASEYQQTFYPIAAQQLQHQGQIVGIPLMYDGLGLYYNKEVLRAANEEVPSTWGDLRLLAQKLTVTGENGVERGGLAIGNTSNVEHFADILGLLIYQNGGDPAQPFTSEVRDAIKFYVSFNQSAPVYSTSLPNSTVAFAREDVAMMFAPSWRAFEIMDMNPDLDFGIAPVPKLSESEYGWATYWAEGVNVNSKNKDAAWQLLKYLSSKEVLRKLHSSQKSIRAFGEIFPRQDMVSEVSDELVTPFLEDAPQAKSWYLCSYTHDDGINDKMIGYYQDAVNNASSSGVDDETLQTLDQGVKQILRQYGVTTSTTQ
jgi:multiple sugar transport system substrate-binding protein